MAILDRATFPREKVCGDFVEPRGLRLFQTMGCLAELEAEDPLAITHVNLFLRNTSAYRERIPFYDGRGNLPQHGYIVPREALDVLGRAEPFLRGEDEAVVEAMRGRLHYGLENWSEAIKHLKLSRQKDFQTWYHLGVAHYRDGDLEAATDALEEAHSKNERHGSTVHFLALAFAKRAESMRDDRTREQLWGRAAGIGEAMIKANPKSADAHNLYARALMGSKRYDAALKEFKKVLELKPAHCFAKHNLAQIYLSKSNWKQAIRHGSKALGCLKGRDEKRVAHMVVGDAQMGVAKAQVEALSETDVPGRRAAIGTYKKALEQVRAAKRIRGSTGLDGKVQAAEATIAAIEEQIATIDENAATEAENERKLREAAEREAALKAATSKGK